MVNILIIILFYLFALTPLAFDFALRNLPFLWKFFISSIITIILFGLIFSFFNSVYADIAGEDINKSRTIKEILIVVISVLLTAFVFHICGII